MTLEAIYYISQIVAVLAVLASLIFVGIQIRQNTEQARRNEEATKAAAAEAAHRSFLDWYHNQTPEMAAIVAKGQAGLEGLSAEDRYMYFAICMPALMNLQEAHTKWAEGSLAEDRWRFWDRFATILSVPASMKDVWQDRRFMFSDDFQAFFDQKLKDIESVSLSTVNWAAGSTHGDGTGPEAPPNGEPDA